ncbi:MAG: metal-dependent amidase/aminoacylase/carboxypeptidase family protein [Candidatus Latescibacterota bacterium]|jgi:metal-dependent amidase/aminoacylase/carboxypeptidase family protein
MNARNKKKRIDQAVQAQAAQARAISRQIHTWAERPFREEQSSQRLAAYLKENDFDIEFPFKKIPTAFRASWGSGKISIGLLGEYDALPNCGAADGAWGHG